MPLGKRTLWAREPAVGDSLAFERSLWGQGYRLVAGTDEAGRGPLAGPVVAACVILPRQCEAGIFKDSKQLTPERRLELVGRLRALPGASWGLGVVSAAEIDRINILQAALLAMKKAVQDLAGLSGGLLPDYLLVDGKFTVALPLPQQALIRGDSRSASIAAASVVAKVRRDEIMAELHQQYPQYNFQQHKGYGTAEHRLLLQAHGPCPEHRHSFKPVRLAIAAATDGRTGEDPR
ncbi:MAG TPA: ribonuclease HII [Desulfurivibrio alkaliphilus]|uniref:Ribonuclease HII n=1 Tax=Desulfurivibrio alkaliphilus TaxID=427923 RepID=A0A7C2XN64_9BACT|nr:ribonuclease HII [Desulfurivibrio alkaliphilus]